MTTSEGRIVNLTGRGPFVPTGILAAGWDRFSVETVPDGEECLLGDDREHACYVLEGEGEVHFEGDSRPLGPGSSIVIPLGTRVTIEGRGDGLRLFRIEMTVARKPPRHG